VKCQFIIYGENESPTLHKKPERSGFFALQIFEFDILKH
jgi:hypothetical protein